MGHVLFLDVETTGVESGSNRIDRALETIPIDVIHQCDVVVAFSSKGLFLPYICKSRFSSSSEIMALTHVVPTLLHRAASR